MNKEEIIMNSNLETWDRKGRLGRKKEQRRQRERRPLGPRAFSLAKMGCVLVVCLMCFVVKSSAVVFTTNVVISKTNTIYDGQDIVIDGAMTVAIDGPHALNSLWLTQVAVLDRRPLIPLHAELRMAPMMPHQRHTDPIGQFAINEVVRKPFEICPMKARLDQVKAPRFHGGQSDRAAQLRLKFFRQPLGNCVVASERFRHIALDRRMILDSHPCRPASTLLQNSVSLSGDTWPLAISCSRRSTSANSSTSDHSSPTGGSEPRSACASHTRCSTGRLNTVFSSSSIADMQAIYRPTAGLQATGPNHPTNPATERCPLHPPRNDSP